MVEGWNTTVEARDYTVAFTRLLAHSPEMRLLRRLVLDDNAFEMEDEFEKTIGEKAAGEPA